MSDIYLDGRYAKLNPSWHEEDSPWKASQIAQIIRSNNLALATVAEIGCGTGEILVGLRNLLPPNIVFTGYEIASAAFDRAEKKTSPRLNFLKADLLESDEFYNLLLIVDVLEHIPDCFGFAKRCRQKAQYKIYHIPIDVSVQSVLRAAYAFPLDSGRNDVGHLHFFTVEHALLVLKESGHRVIDTVITESALALAHLHPSAKTFIANVPRRVLGKWSKSWAARLLGGYSLLALCE